MHVPGRPDGEELEGASEHPRLGVDDEAAALRLLVELTCLVELPALTLGLDPDGEVEPEGRSRGGHTGRGRGA